MLPFEAGVQLLQPLEHLERGAHGSLRVVLVRRPGRRTPPEPRRRCTSRRCRPTNRPPRPSAVKYRCRTDRRRSGSSRSPSSDEPVRSANSDRGELALLAPLRAPERRGARVAEPRALRVLLPAPRADRHALRVSRGLRRGGIRTREGGCTRNRSSVLKPVCGVPILGPAHSRPIVRSGPISMVSDRSLQYADDAWSVFMVGGSGSKTPPGSMVTIRIRS